MGICTALGLILEDLFHPANLVMVYLAGIVFVATRRGRASALATVLGSIFVYDLILVPPRWSLKPAEPQYWLAFAVMLGVGLLISRLAAEGREQATMAEARELRAEALAQLATALARARSADEICARLVEAVRRSLGCTACVLLGGDAVAHPPGSGGEIADLDATLARAVLLDGGERGIGTSLPAGPALRYIPLVVDQRVLGVLVLRPTDATGSSPEDRHFERALASQAAIALDRAHHEALSAAAAVETERERLRSTLLAGISHDFRTPLTAIVGSATTLLEQGERCAPQQRRELLADLLDEAQRLHVLASNLLELTRLEEGAVRPSFEWCPADELVNEGLEVARRQLAGHRVDVGVDPDELVWCDPRMIVQVLANLLDNAARHTPAGGRIAVRVAASGQRWSLVVRDSGPGIPAGHEEAVFRKFHRAGADGDAAGKGLGLAICAAVAQLHGGTITARNDGGAVFELTLPLPPRPQPADGALAAAAGSAWR